MFSYLLWVSHLVNVHIRFLLKRKCPVKYLWADMIKILIKKISFRVLILTSWEKVMIQPEFPSPTLISWRMPLLFLFIHSFSESLFPYRSHWFAVVGKKTKTHFYYFSASRLLQQATYCAVSLQQLSLSGRRVNNDKRKQDTLWSHWCSKTKYGVIFFLKRRNFINVFSP